MSVASEDAYTIASAVNTLALFGTVRGIETLRAHAPDSELAAKVRKPIPQWKMALGRANTTPSTVSFTEASSLLETFGAALEDISFGEVAAVEGLCAMARQILAALGVGASKEELEQMLDSASESEENK